MESRLKLDFLKIEFRKLYSDINNIFNYKNHRLLEEFNNIAEYIILIICEKNKILYDEKISLNENITKLYEKNILSGKIFRITSLVVSQINVYYESKEDDDNDNWFEEFIEKYRTRIYEILVYVVVKCGEENYSLIVDGLEEWKKSIFNSYYKKEVKEENKDVVLYKKEDEDRESSEEKSKQLLEKGENYYFGRGVKKSNREALKNFIEAAKYDNEVAQAYLGLFFERGISVEKNYEMAAKWYNKAAIKGNSFAQYSLGVLYLNGNGVSKDYNKALIWLGKSSENEYAPSYYQLGRIYYNGFGVEKNLEFAFKWYKKGAEENFPAAQHALSYMYKNGEGCEKNIVKAYYWIEKSAENDYEDSYYIVGKSYLDGICYEADFKKAFYYLNKGNEAIDINCIEALGDMYYSGLYVEKDINQALELYNRAIDFGNTNLYFKVAKIYEEEGMVDEAISAYEEGSKNDDVRCDQRLGIIYYNGEGVPRDLEKAMKYIEKASAKDAPHAMYMLGIAYLRLNKFGEETTNISKKLLQEAYELKSAYAAEYLAFLMLNDQKSWKEINENKLLEYINFAFENGIVGSLFQYGYIYEKGIVVEKDLEKSYYYYKSAADKGYVKAIVKIASWYKYGIFVAQDINEAIRLYDMAAVYNDVEAVERLIEIYELGIGDKKSERKAISYVFKLIELDALKGKSKLAYYCMKGIGIEKDINRGNEIINEIDDIDKGTADNLKGMLAEENLIDMSKDEIVKTYMEGIDLGNPDCYGNLACYLYNNNLHKDKQYEECFSLAMEGKELGIKKCKYIYLKDMLKKKEESSIVTEEEMEIVKEMRNIINKGIYEAINDLLEWHIIRERENDKDYYELKKQAIFYQVEEINKRKEKLTRKEVLDIATTVSIIALIIVMIITITR